MSLSAALKAGLGKAFDESNPEPTSSGAAGNDWDPYPETKKSAATQPAAQPQARTMKGAVAKMASAKMAGATAGTPAPANVNQAAARQAAKAAAPKQARPEASRKSADWMQNAEARPAVNPQQYVRELERFLAERNRTATRSAVLEVSSAEVEGIATLAARIRGRYLAKLLDAGNSEDVVLHEGELRELTRYREGYEELLRGLDLMKESILNGDITVHGMIR